MGGYITGIIGVLIFPWKLMADPNGYIFTWLIAYSSLLGPIGGILICDYFLIRKKQLILDELYQHNGRYGYTNGYNLTAIIALLAGIIPNIPGFLVNVKLINENLFPAWLNGLYNYAWFVGFFVSAFLYWIMTKKSSNIILS
jgi:NCS1 family nucleobase:cation symporter-1